MKARRDAKKEVSRLREEEAENKRLQRQLKKLETLKVKLESAGITSSALNLSSQMPSVPPEKFEKYRLHYSLPNVNDIHPEVKKYFEDNPITLDHLTKPKYATALPVPPDLVEKYFKYKQNKHKKIVSDQSSPPPKEPAVSAKSTTSTGELCKIQSKEKMKPSPPRSSGKRAAKVHKKAPKVK